MTQPSNRTLFVYLVPVVAALCACALPATAQTPCNNPGGPDVIVGVLVDVNNYGSLNGIASFSVGTISCNMGDQTLKWISNTNEHPVIGQNMFRLKNGRFEQIGQAWLKHGFTALANNDCCTCQNPGTGTRLGIGCSDPYVASLNGNQTGQGPKFEVNPHTGVFSYPYTAQGQSGDTIYKRLQARISDLDPAQNGGGQYYVEGQYVTADDAAAGHQNNNASYRTINVSGSGTNWSIALTGTTQREKPAIRAWKVADPAVTETDVQISGDGLVIVSARVTSLGSNVYHYEYAVQNLNSDRAVGSFTVPLPPGVTVSNVGFHDVDYHSGEPYSGADWTPTVTSSSVTWETQPFTANANANALRWGTLYNFRFDANATSGAISATLGLFKPGVPASVTAATVGPTAFAGPIDCNTNGTTDSADIAAGTSQDCNANAVPDECDAFPPAAIGVQLVAGGFTSPIYVCAAPGDTTRLFVVEQGGIIKIRNLTTNTTLATPFLNISTIITSGGERGLLGLAFHPNYAANGRFYVNYTNSSGNTVIAQYTVSSDPNVANPASAVVLKTIAQPEANHNGGCIQFGPDGMLYVGVGDGGGANDQHGTIGNGQATDTLLGKILRLNVDNPPTYIPANNPFVAPGNPLDEIWAIGMRNPWRFSFDRLKGDLYIGDVGQDAREEIDFEPAGFPGGRNYGWRCMEGFGCTGLSGCTCNAAGLTLPILEYMHSSLPGAPCVSLTGGYVYRGCAIPSLSGTYFYSDYCANFIRSFRYANGVVSDQQDRTAALGNIAAPVSFGEDAAGELYVVSYLGNIYRIVESTGPVCGNGIVEPGEQCDDANTNAGDGCFNCMVEAGNNDVCAAAIPVCNGMFTGSTIGRTNDGSASCGSSATSPDVWFSYTPTLSGTVNVSTCGTNDLGGTDAGMDTVLSIHSGCPGTTANQLACNDDWGSGGLPANACTANDLGTAHYDSAVSASVVAGRTYLIRVSGYGGGSTPSTGNFILNVSGPTCAIQRDCNTNLIDDSIELAAGAPDCNNNSTLDLCDIASGASYDCAHNGTPDECESAPTVVTYTRNVTPPLAIPDNNTNFVSDVFTVADHGTINDLNLGVRIVHTWNGDLIVRIAHGTTTVVVIDRPGRTTTGFGFDNDGFDIILDDEGTGGPIENANVPTGVVSPPSYVPNNPLSAFDGQDRFGTWTISVSDRASGDTGTLNQWRLIFTTPVTPQPCPPDCNTNNTADSVDISSGQSLDCNANATPDECDVRSNPALDYDGGPVGIRAAGQTIIATSCFGCHNNDGSGGSGGGCGGTCPGPNIRNRSRVFIWNRLLPPTNHPGGAHPEFTQQDFANLEAFLADGGSRGRPDRIPDSCQTLADCNSNGVSDGRELELGTQVDLDYNGIPDNCESCPGTPGDLNVDGRIDGPDMQLFLNCLITGATTGGNCRCGDMNASGTVTPADVGPFVQALLAG